MKSDHRQHCRSLKMKSLTAHIKRAGLKTGIALIVLSAVGAMPNVWAAAGETTAGTSISNTATVNYSVGGVSQTAVPSNASAFLVDKKVDLTVAKGSGVTTVPGGSNIGLPFTVANTGNASDSFTLTAANVAAGDNFDTTAFAVYLDVNGNGVYDAGTDTAIAAPVTIARDASIKVLIVSTIPGTVINGNTANMTLTATTTSTKTAGAESATVVDVVFADAANDGTEKDTNTYTISTATLAVVKSAVVISDPVNNATNPKAIPGAVVEYTITVTNSGAAAATAVTLTDNIPANTTYVAGSMKLGAATLTDAADADGGVTTGAPVTSISVNAGSIAGSGGSSIVKFRVTVN
jgi:uncharacterized repeat protein (TIGR01451 family)